MTHPTLMNAAPAETAAAEKDLPFVAWFKPEENPALPLNKLHAGDTCPKCQAGRLDYDGLLNLACNKCGYTLSGGAGCT